MECAGVIEGEDHEEFILERLKNAIDQSVDMQYVIQART